MNTGLYLRAGETAEITAAGTWTVDGASLGPDGDPGLDEERGCTKGMLVARSGLRFEEAVTCIGEGATFTAPSDDIVYVGMIFSTDLGETYGDRLRLGGAIEVTVTSEGDTVPTVAADAVATYDFDAVASGQVELESDYNLVTIDAAQVALDRDEAVEGLATLDSIYTIEADMRGMTPFSGQRVRWYPDETISAFAYMLAGNPVRCDPGLMTGNDSQRILRSGETGTDIWGFAHELGHTFTLANGAWVYMYTNLESWPNLFTLRALEELGRTDDQPNYDSYCDGREAFLSAPEYEQVRDDPFLQLCFLKEFEAVYGDDFYDDFYRGMNEQSNDDLRYDGTDASIWRYVRDRFDLSAGEDTSYLFEEWAIPLE